MRINRFTWGAGNTRRYFDWDAWGLSLLAMAPMLLVYLSHIVFVPRGIFRNRISTV